jgi:hypothetical protein
MGSGAREYFRAFRAQWLAAMSGSASVPFAIAGTLAADWSQWVLLAAAIFCGGLSSFLVWKKERERANQLAAQILEITVSKLTLTFLRAIISEAGDATQVTAVIRVLAAGAPTSAVNWKMELILEDGTKIEGGPITIAKDEKLDFKVGDSQIQRYVYADSLAVRCSTLLPARTAVLGVTAFRFPNVPHAKAVHPKTRFVIGAQDGGGVWHESSMSFEELAAAAGKLTDFHTLEYPHLISLPAESGQPATEVGLFLQFGDSDHSVPREIRQTNVHSWRALYTESIAVEMKDKEGNLLREVGVPPRWSIFLLFGEPTTFRQLVVKGVGGREMKCDVWATTDRFAIVTVLGSVARATLEISSVN